MPVTINGTSGVVSPDGSAGTPAYQGSDANTGMFFPAADTIAFSTAGTEDMRIDSSGNVGIGTSSPAGRLSVQGSASASAVNIDLGNNAAQAVGDAVTIRLLTSSAFVAAPTAAPYISAIQTNASTSTTDIAFGTFNGTSLGERARIDSSGNLLVGTTGSVSSSNKGVFIGGDPSTTAVQLSCGSKTASNGFIFFINGNGTVGSIVTSGSSTTYNTSSDYRLKEAIVPMQGALAKVAALKPVTYKWKADGSDGEGFIAHELQEVVPDCVTGEKDAVDADGKPVYQGIDTSFLVATLTAAIQELKGIVDSQAARIAALEGAAQ